MMTGVREAYLKKVEVLNLDAYDALLAGALHAVEKLVSTTALDRNTPLGAWFGCRPVVRATAEAGERRTRGDRGCER